MRKSRHGRGRFEAISALIILSALLTLAGCDTAATDGPAPQAAEVVVYTVKSQAVPLATELSGRTAANMVAEVRPQVNGIVVDQVFVEGSQVKEGDTLYRIDSAVYKANYDKAVANVENLERLAKRKESLKNQNSISAQDYEDAMYAFEEAKADAELARLNLTYCEITAPLSGKIGRSNITKGALVTNGQAQAMATINQLDPISVDLTPAVSQLLQAGQNIRSGAIQSTFSADTEVWLILEDGSAYPLPGKIKFLDNQVDESTGTVTLRAEFPNPRNLLLPGMYVRARVQTAVVPDGIVIPQQALSRDMKGNPQVWVVTPENKAEARLIQADRSLGNTWLVSGGLAAGERVVTEGVQRLTSGASVAPREAENLDMKLTFDEPRQPAAEGE